MTGAGIAGVSGLEEAVPKVPYVRVTQVDRHMAWSSPIWVDAQ